jgi:hypothetical protein
MITNKNEYLHYIKEDQRALGAYTKHPIFSDNIMILLNRPMLEVSKIITQA